MVMRYQPLLCVLPSARLGHLAVEEDQEVVSEVVWDIVDVAWEHVYHNWVQKEIFPYAVEDARKKLLQSVAVRTSTHHTPHRTHRTHTPHTYVHTQ